MPESVDDRTPLLPHYRVAPSGPSRPGHLPPKQTHLAKCFGAVSAGKLPSQAQISNVLAQAVRADILDVDSSPEDATRSGKALSEGGRRVVTDARALLLELKAFGEAKNADDTFQDFWYHSQQSRMGLTADVTKPAKKQELATDYDRLLQTIGVLSRIFLSRAVTTSPAALLNDALLVARDILADAAESVSQPVGDIATTLRPTEEERRGAGGLENEVQKGKEVITEILGGKEGTLGQRATNVITQDIEDQAVERFRMLVERMQEDPAFEPALITLIDLAYKYTTRTSSATSSTLASVSLSDPTEHTRAALHYLGLIIEALSNRPLKPLSDALDGVIKAITADPQLTAYFQRLDEHVRRVLTDRPYAHSVAAARRTQEVYRQGQELLQIKPEWKQAALKLLVELEQVVIGILTDERVNNLALAVGNIIKDTVGMGYVITGVARGNVIAVWRDIADVILPAIARVVKRIPMPRFEFDSPDIAFVLDDVIFESANFLPDHFGFTTSNDVQVSAAPDEPTLFDSTLRIRFDGLRINIHDAPFWISLKRSWLPFLHEQYGIIDFSILKSGLGMDVEIRFPADLPTGIFTVESVAVHVKHLDFNIRGSKYPWLIWLLRPLMRAGLRLGLKLVLQQYITYGLAQLDQAVWVYQQRKQQWEILGMEPQEAATNAVVIGEPGDAPHANGGDEQDDKKSMLEGVEISATGIVKRDEEAGTAIGIGAEQLLPGVGGPPSKWGRSSVARRVAMVEDDVQGEVDNLEQTVDGMRESTRQAVIAVDQVDLQGMVEVAAEERREDAEEEGWQSDAFDLW